jgi:FlaG/FlaF family flagellin (archaellin)
MNLRKLKRRLGVSTVIANMMMISITLALAAILVAWAGTSFGAFSGGTQVYFQQRGQALQERFVIEYVNFSVTNPTNGITLFVRNVGAEEINLAAIYVNGTSYTCTSSTCNTFGVGSIELANSNSLCAAAQELSQNVVRIGVGGVCQINLQWSAAWTAGSIFNIVAATTRGNQATVTSRAP